MSGEKKLCRRIFCAVLLMAASVILFACQKKKAPEHLPVFETVEDVNGHPIGMMGGASHEKAVRERFPDSEIFYFTSFADCIAALDSGRIEAYITDESQARNQIEAVSGLGYLPERLIPENYAFMLGKDRLPLCQEINGELEKMKAEGIFSELKDKWFGDAGEKTIRRTEKADTSKGILTVYADVEVKPFCYIKDGEIVGYETELIVKAAERLGYEARIETANFGGFVPALTGGKADVAIGCITVMEERKEQVLFSDAIYESGPVVVYLNGETGQKGVLQNIKDSFYRTFVKENRWKMIADGLWITVWLSLASTVLGTILGFFVSFPLRSENRLVRNSFLGISTFLDGMPMVILLMALYYVFFKNLDISALWVAVIGLTVDFANVVAGLLNAGVHRVDKGQLEAAESMGYDSWKMFSKIVFPQAAMQMFPQYKGAVISLVKGTSVVGFITVEDLTKASDVIRSLTYEAFFPLIVTAVLYFLLAHCFIFFLSRIGMRLDPKRRPRQIKGVQTHDND